MDRSWDDIASQSPLATTDWSQYFADQVPQTGWWNDTPSPFAYAPEMGVGSSFDYDPGATAGVYSPTSSLTMRMIDSDIDSWLRREHPELYDFTSGVPMGGVAGVGTVAQDPNFGQFYRTPEVYGEIQAAASKYGVPANFLQAIIARESSGDWNSNNTWVHSVRGGKRIYGYVGVFEDAARSWGFDFDSLNNNRAAQIEMLASGLRGFYDKARARNPEYGWLNAASMHFSGTFAINNYVDELGNNAAAYVNTIKDWWQDLDAKAGNTWSNYTSTDQNTGIGSPQTQAWGRYAQWDQALVGLGSNSGAPANLLKAMLRYGDEQGFGYSNNFDNAFAPQVDVLAENYRRTGDWNTAAAATMGTTVNDPAFKRVKSYWDDLNADMSGVFGGMPSDTQVSSQFDAIWGGGDRRISQEIGPTGYATGEGAWQYGYAEGLGIVGHPGVDVSMVVGTPLYSPVAGTVITTGGSGYFYNTSGSAYQEGLGELRIRLDNGHELILGHMSDIDVQVGQRVTPGMLMGLSGYPSAPHVHVEYRRPSDRTSTGWEAVDPRSALGGTFTGFHQGARTGLGHTQPMTFQALMRAGASGAPIPSGPVYAQGGGNSAWTSWLRNAMLGNDPGGVRAGGLDYGSIYNSLG